MKNSKKLYDVKGLPLPKRSKNKKKNKKRWKKFLKKTEKLLNKSGNKPAAARSLYVFPGYGFLELRTLPPDMSEMPERPALGSLLERPGIVPVTPEVSVAEERALDILQEVSTNWSAGVSEEQAKLTVIRPVVEKHMNKLPPEERSSVIDAVVSVAERHKKEHATDEDCEPMVIARLVEDELRNHLSVSIN